MTDVEQFSFLGPISVNITVCRINLPRTMKIHYQFQCHEAKVVLFLLLYCLNHRKLQNTTVTIISW